MLKNFRYITALLAAAALTSAAVGQVALDLNPAPGDQGEHERTVKPGEAFSIELIALGDMEGKTGFSLVLRFDQDQLNFKGYNGGGLLAGAMSMPPKAGPEGVEISAAILGRNGAKEGSGPIGKLLFEAKASFTATRIGIVKANLGSPGAGIQEVGGANGIEIVAPGQRFGSHSPPPHGGPQGSPSQSEMDHDNDDGPPSPAEIKAMDKGIRKRINRLPQRLRKEAHEVQDLHLRALKGMASGAPDEELKQVGLKAIDTALGFFERLAEDPKAVRDRAVHELVHFIHNDFGEGDVPKRVRTLDMIKDEIEHLKEERRDFTQDFGGAPPRPEDHYGHDVASGQSTQGAPPPPSGGPHGWNYGAPPPDSLGYGAPPMPGDPQGWNYGAPPSPSGDPQGWNYGSPPSHGAPPPHHDDGEDAPPSPAEINAMDQALRERIDRLPSDLRERGHKVQDLHMAFVKGMAMGEPDKNLALNFFKAAIGFLDRLAKDRNAEGNEAVHELIHFIHNDFGEGDVPKDIPTRDMILNEIEHLKGEREHFIRNFP